MTNTLNVTQKRTWHCCWEHLGRRSACWPHEPSSCLGSRWCLLQSGGEVQAVTRRSRQKAKMSGNLFVCLNACTHLIQSKGLTTSLHNAGTCSVGKAKSCHGHLRALNSMYVRFYERSRFNARIPRACARRW